MSSARVDRLDCMDIQVVTEWCRNAVRRADQSHFVRWVSGASTRSKGSLNEPTSMVNVVPAVTPCAVEERLTASAAGAALKWIAK
jgi:hypothetical protein